MVHLCCFVFSILCTIYWYSFVHFATLMSICSYVLFILFCWIYLSYFLLLLLILSSIGAALLILNFIFAFWLTLRSIDAALMSLYFIGVVTLTFFLNFIGNVMFCWSCSFDRMYYLLALFCSFCIIGFCSSYVLFALFCWF